MTYRRLVSGITVVSLAATLGATRSADAQTTGVGRTPWGDPDLQGTYTSNGVRGVPLERPPEVLTEEDEAREEALAEFTSNDRLLNVVFPEPDTDVTRGFTPPSALVVDPSNGRIPLTAEAKAASDAWKVASHGVGINGLEDLDLWDRCITKGASPTGMLPTGYNKGVMILQTPDYVAILHEIIHDVRIIPIGDPEHLDSKVRQYWGDSRGHWEGDTLVVEVTNFSDKTFGTQQPHGSYRGDGREQRVVERFTRISEGVLEYQATVEDPRASTQPWTFVVPLLKDDGYMLYEYACHEGNYGFEQILRAYALDK